MKSLMQNSMNQMQHPFSISTDPSLLDVDVIHHYLSDCSYWATGRSREAVEKSIRHSLCFGVYDAKHQQVGFARVISDYTVFAWLLDVFILEAYQGIGLSKLLLTEIFHHPDLQNLKRWGLATKDAHGLYEKYGFHAIAEPAFMMEKRG